jgi:hypothetical protein
VQPVRVTLHYRTDDRYYISRGAGPIIALKKDIPEALIFPK